MPQGQGVPTCQSQNLTGIVWSPTSNSTYHPGQTFAITFTTLKERDIEHGRDYYYSVWVTCLHQSDPDYATINLLSKLDICKRSSVSQVMRQFELTKPNRQAIDHHFCNLPKR